MQNRINPVGLKGNEVNDRIKQLMVAIAPINEEHKNSVVELTKVGPDGNVYAIVRENHRYFIKSTAKKEGKMLSEDFNYMGGLQNKNDEVYPSYAKAIKHLNIKFNSLAESLGKVNTINVFENDQAKAGGFAQYEGNGFSGEGNLGENIEEIEESEIEMTEEEQAIDNMMKEDSTSDVVEEDKMPVTENKKLSIGRMMNEMDGIIDGLTKKKNYKLI